VVNEDKLSRTEEAVVWANGTDPNGTDPNGTDPNGTDPNGTDPNGTDPNGTDPNGTDPNGILLNGIEQYGMAADGAPIGIAGSGAPLAGADLIGSTWTGVLSSGNTVALRVDDARQGAGANADVWSYRFSVSASGTWRPLCRDHAGNERFADTVPGTWNLARGVPGGGSYHPEGPQFTIACRGYAIAKCVELGYKPWAGLAPELTTCVRALRADYCGDGTPYTVDGTLIDIYDRAGVQVDDEAWVPEAAWTPEGASCISKMTATRFWQVAHQTPWCFPHALKPKNSCGAGFTDGALIITELRPQ
jgi:hypothetical protein